MEFSEPSNWQQDTHYDKYSVVSYGGNVYFCLKPSKGIAPSQNPSYWADDSTFVWEATNNSDIGETPMTIQTKFGDGYDQRTKIGPNNSFLKSINLRFEGIRDAEAQAILYFLYLKGGYKSFYYTPPAPYENKIQVICRSSEHSVVYHNDNTITATFEEFYDYADVVTAYTVGDNVQAPIRLYAENAHTRKLESFLTANWEYYNESAIRSAPLLTTSPYFPVYEIYAPLNNFGKFAGDYIKLQLYDAPWTQGGWSVKNPTLPVQFDYFDHVDHPVTGGLQYRPYILDGHVYPILVKTDSIRDESDLESRVIILDDDKYTPQLFPFQDMGQGNLEDGTIDGSSRISFYIGWSYNGCFLPIDLALKSWWHLKSANFNHALHDDIGGSTTIYTPQAPILNMQPINRAIPQTGASWERFYDSYGAGNTDYNDPDYSGPVYAPDAFDYTCQSLMWSWINDMYDPLLAKDFDGTPDEAKYGLGYRGRYHYVKRPGFDVNYAFYSFTCNARADRTSIINPHVFHYGIDPSTFFGFSLGGGAWNPITNNKDWMTFGQAVVGCGRGIPGACYNPAVWAGVSYGSRVYLSVTRCCGYYTSQKLPDESYMDLKFYTK